MALTYGMQNIAHIQSDVGDSISLGHTIRPLIDRTFTSYALEEKRFDGMLCRSYSQ